MYVAGPDARFQEGNRAAFNHTAERLANRNLNAGRIMTRFAQAPAEFSSTSSPVTASLCPARTIQPAFSPVDERSAGDGPVYHFNPGRIIRRH
jgi:hypothetical protein